MAMGSNASCLRNTVMLIAKYSSIILYTELGYKLTYFTDDLP